MTNLAVSGAVPSIAESAQQQFLRYEFKYILSGELRIDLEADIKHLLELDPHVVSLPRHTYFVRSLYFDDPALSSYYDKVDGVMHRAKYRLRTYSTELSTEGALFLELKGRHNQHVFKRRACVDRIRFGRASRGPDVARRLLDTTDRGTLLHGFRYELLRKSLRPTMLIDYERRPYRSRLSTDFRLTFDENVSAMPADRLFPAASEKRRAVLPGCTIMELKFKTRIPVWFHRVIQNYQLKCTPCSKVCKGIEAWGLAAHGD